MISTRGMLVIIQDKGVISRPHMEFLEHSLGRLPARSFSRLPLCDGREITCIHVVEQLFSNEAST
jgi:hypothetical protein